MTRPTIPAKNLFAFVVVGLACFSLFIPSAPAAKFHEVKYFFDNVEKFSSDIPRSGITEKVIVRGRFITYMPPVQCVKAPCPPVRAFGLQDIDDENYRFHLFDGNKLLRRLKVGNVYVLAGLLEKSVDVGRRTV